MPVLGRHMPLDGHPLAAFVIAKDLGCETIQLFVGNPRGWLPMPERLDEISALAEGLRVGGFKPIVIHAAYLINLASSTEETRIRSRRLLRWTVERGAAIGAHAVVIHIGSHGGAGLDIGIAHLVAGLSEVLTDLPPGPQILLENDVGAGNTIGSRFDAMAAVLAQLDEPFGARLGVCLDTAHLWGAGFDIGTPDAANTTLAHIDATVGLARVGVIHLNDTVTALAGHRDLHARLGEGSIGAAGLRTFLRDPRLSDAAIILETPIKDLPGSDKHDWEHDRTQIQAARELLSD